ncbi:hypothetical protein DLAC_01646 [Tieghemostelium lacteum]|uniref:Uncharacterized protein n=1 Tax=Tieghemostelium lacteum TaxID=361077 RepID=A0A152A5Z6_TIELA|nr:hypothetical protein DLAC_01646 [Tieghemostelium lacteum]|eukprot:KYR01643.1 hypothetical protein DLAC_01646 [Tieghemostelium lacteum]
MDKFNLINNIIKKESGKGVKILLYLETYFLNVINESIFERVEYIFLNSNYLANLLPLPNLKELGISSTKDEQDELLTRHISEIPSIPKHLDTLSINFTSNIWRGTNRIDSITNYFKGHSIGELSLSGPKTESTNSQKNVKVNHWEIFDSFDKLRSLQKLHLSNLYITPGSIKDLLVKSECLVTLSVEKLFYASIDKSISSEVLEGLSESKTITDVSLYYISVQLNELVNMLNSNKTVKRISCYQIVVVENTKYIVNDTIENLNFSMTPIENRFNISKLWKTPSNLKAITITSDDSNIDYILQCHKKCYFLSLMLKDTTIQQIVNIINSKPPFLHNLELVAVSYTKINYSPIFQSLLNNHTLTSINFKKDFPIDDIISLIQLNHPTIRTIQCEVINGFNQVGLFNSLISNPTLENIYFYSYRYNVNQPTNPDLIKIQIIEYFTLFTKLLNTNERIINIAIPGPRLSNRENWINILSPELINNFKSVIKKHSETLCFVSLPGENVELKHYLRHYLINEY